MGLREKGIVSIRRSSLFLLKKSDVITLFLVLDACYN